MSNAILFHRTGGPEVLEFTSVYLGEPGPGQALIEQRAIGVNYIDTYHRSGLYPLPSFPAGLGVEAAGVVISVGPGVTEVAPGQRVAYAGGAPGAYAERRVVPSSRLVPLPDSISDETAAAVLLKGMTAEMLIRRVYPVRAGQSALLHAAAGGVGLLASQWLSALGVRVLACVGSDEKAELARANGASETIVTTRENFVERVRALTDGKGVDVVYDSVGKATLLGSLDCLVKRGTLVLYGNASGKPDPLDLQLLATKGSLFVTRPTVFDYVATPSELQDSASALFGVLASSAVRVLVGQRFALRDAAQAHRALESRATRGSSVLIP